MSDLLQFCINKSYKDSLDGNKMHIANYNIETSNTTIVITLKNMLINVDVQDLVACMDSTYKIILNSFSICITNYIDK